MKKIYSNLSKELREEIGRRSFPVRTGDEVEIMRGDFKGSEGEIESIERKTGKVKIRGANKEKPDGTKYQIPVHASNLKIISLSNKEERI